MKRASLFSLVLLLVPAIQSAAQWDVRLENSLCGTPNSPIRIEVYSDFECPACRAFYLDTIRQVLRNYGASDRVCVVYHEFPLNMHRYSREASRYSLAAQRLGRKQWAAVLDALYFNAPQWALDGRIENALLGVVSAEDFAKMKKILQDSAIEEAIVREIAHANQRAVKSTPTVFVSAVNRKEQKVEGMIPYDALRAFIAEALR